MADEVGQLQPQPAQSSPVAARQPPLTQRPAGHTPVKWHPDNWWRTLVMLAADCLYWPIALLFTATVEEQPLGAHSLALLALIASSAQLVAGLATGLYRRRYLPFSFEEIGAAGLTVGIAGVVMLVADRLLRRVPFGHRCVWATATAGSLVLTARYLRRARARWVQSRTIRRSTAVVVIGAGEGASRAIHAMRSSSAGAYRPVAMVDDDPNKRNVRIMGVRVLGTTADLTAVATATGAEAALIAIPSAAPDLLRRLHARALAAGVDTLVLPPVQQLVGRGSVAEIRSYTDEEVLQRQVVSFDNSAVRSLVGGRRVLVTGAGGSIGSELSLQLAALGPSALVLLDHDDSLLHAIERNLAAQPIDVTPVSVLADIRDATRIDEVFDLHQPELVLHAAALKHVPALEAAPHEGWKTNVIGTRNVLAAAERVGVHRFVTISTDKAADPVNVLGRTKLAAERLTAAVAERTGRAFVSVRFGNVISSRGSVMETFQHQIERGGPVTVTHPDVTRFFMAVREAVRLTLEAAVVGAPGETLVLDMGTPVRILDVARTLVEQSGQEIEIVFTGLRPGEKLHEVLTGGGERPTRPRHPLIDHVCVSPAWAIDEFPQD